MLRAPTKVEAVATATALATKEAKAAVRRAEAKATTLGRMARADTSPPEKGHRSASPSI